MTREAQTEIGNETPKERRRRLKREANARWMAKPENRANYNERVAAPRSMDGGRARAR